jgi:dihydrofolate reductase
MENEIKINAILACDLNNGIGKNNDLPWSMPDEYSYFLSVIRTTKDSTKINALIFGKNTWLSIPVGFRPIKPCLNVVLSSQLETSDDGDFIIATDLSEGIRRVQTDFKDRVESIYICGGAGVYECCWNQSLLHNIKNLNRLYLTRIHYQFNCDVILRPANFLNNFNKLSDECVNEEELMFKCKYNSILTDQTSNLNYVLEVYTLKNDYQNPRQKDG